MYIKLGHGHFDGTQFTHNKLWAHSESDSVVIAYSFEKCFCYKI